MLNQREKLLQILSEECSEVIQAASKVIRFQSDSMHNEVSNRDRLVQELGDVTALIQLVCDDLKITKDEILSAVEIKKEKLKLFL